MARKAGMMQAQRKAKQWGVLFKRGFVLLCTLSLFFGVGMILFLTLPTHANSVGQRARGNNGIDIDITPTVTIAPTTATAIPTPTATTPPTPTPTSIPTTVPTPRPTVPKPPPTPVPPLPTATTIAGVPPPVGNNPTPLPTTGPATSPTPRPKTTATPVALSPTPAATHVVTSPAANTNTTTTATAPSTGSGISLPQVVSIAGGAVILGGALFMFMMWRQRRMKPPVDPAYAAQSVGERPQQGRAVTEPLYHSPQPLVPQPIPSQALVMSSANGSPLPYTQADMQQNSLPDQGLAYRAASPTPLWEARRSVAPPQVPVTAELIESMMRQAQMGLFALPDQRD